MTLMLRTEGLAKTFVLHTQGGKRLPVLGGVEFAVAAGECVALHGPSGSGKSTLLRCLYGNYKPSAGRVLLRDGDREIDLTAAAPGEVIALRRGLLTVVTQFLRVIPRVPALEIVAEPARASGLPAEEARARAAALLTRLRIPEPLWGLAPATFSGGEQQRVNLARGFVVERPILLLDEPTASLDPANRETVIELILEAKARGAAVAGIFHDAEVRSRAADRLFELQEGKAAA